ncbi:MAG TPA: hypothetical protein VKE98_03810 [Gemmataceae bacterium]|nr:hypothetical protein [Gemmataceae bacterium]
MPDWSIKIAPPNSRRPTSPPVGQDPGPHVVAPELQRDDAGLGRHHRLLLQVAPEHAR